MAIEACVVPGVLAGAGLFLMLQPSFVRVLFGFVLFSNAVNLLILAVSGNPSGKQPPVVLPGAERMADPLPQALILTAIVIGFGVTAYLIALLYRLFLDQKTTHAGEMFGETAADRGAGGAP